MTGRKTLLCGGFMTGYNDAEFLIRYGSWPHAGAWDVLLELVILERNVHVGDQIASLNLVTLLCYIAYSAWNT